MKNFFQNRLNYFYIFIFFYSIIGIFLSLNVGITHDEAHSSWVWELNKKNLINIFLTRIMMLVIWKLIMVFTALAFI